MEAPLLSSSSSISSSSSSSRFEAVHSLQSFIVCVVARASRLHRERLEFVLLVVLRDEAYVTVPRFSLLTAIHHCCFDDIPILCAVGVQHYGPRRLRGRVRDLLAEVEVPVDGVVAGLERPHQDEFERRRRLNRMEMLLVELIQLLQYVLGAQLVLALVRRIR